VSVVKEGYIFAAGPIVLAAFGLVERWYIPGAILLLLAAFILYFFRDPHREIPADPASVVSPADGRIIEIIEEALGSRPGRRISIFLAIWNVHVNRSPLSGRIAKIEYRPGRFHMAMKKAASSENEMNIVHLETPRGDIVFKQIAGLIARRVVLWKKTGDQLERGERIGIVRFGSRMDLWLPLEAQIVVKVGDHVAGGSSVVARWP
jgi:phosphatidylserine decarboxylase